MQKTTRKRDGSSEVHLEQRQQDKITKRNIARAKKARTERNHALEMASLRFDNLERYKSMKMRGKICFARNGYSFANNPNEPAIEIFETGLDTPEGMNRGIRVGKGFPELPANFIILYSHNKVNTKKSTDNQRHYQVEIVGKQYISLHTEPTEPFGLANFINCALQPSANPATAISPITNQDMRQAQCELKRSQTGFSKEMREKYPSYVKTMKKIPQGHELLMRYGSSHRL
jgi:hypothetical protein